MVAASSISNYSSTATPRTAAASHYPTFPYPFICSLASCSSKPCTPRRVSDASDASFFAADPCFGVYAADMGCIHNQYGFAKSNFSYVGSKESVILNQLFCISAMTAPPGSEQSPSSHFCLGLLTQSAAYCKHSVSSNYVDFRTLRPLCSFVYRFNLNSESPDR